MSSSASCAFDLTASLAKCLWVALATSSKQLQLVQVALAWNLSPQESIKGPAAQGPTLNPSLKGRQMAITSWLPGDSTDSPLESLMTQISFLEFVPAAFDQATKAWLQPYILAVRSFVPTPDMPYTQEVQSVIDRWEVISDQAQTLHPAFENLGSRRNSVGAAAPLVSQHEMAATSSGSNMSARQLSG
jgi:mediator of RNA polymerase II transcription subunit 16, fungi type